MQDLKKIVLGLILLASFQACRKATTANWDVDLVIPVTTSHLNISNFIGDSIVKADNTGLFHLRINRELAALKLDSLLQLPDTTISNNFPWPLYDYTLTAGQVIPLLNAPNETKFNLPNGIQLKKVEIKKSLLNIKFSNTISQPLDIVFLLPGVTKDGKSFLINETVPTGSNTLVKSYDLAGYTIDMTGANKQLSNTIVQNFTIAVNSKAQDVVVSFGQGLFMEIGYTNVQPQFVEGYFGQQTLALPSDTATFSFYKNFSANNFVLKDANLNFSIINEIGADFSGSISKLSSFNSVEKKTVLMNNTQLNRMNINPATRINNAVTASTLAVTFNTVNSNITSFISNLPDKISYTGTVVINPLGDLVKNYSQFAYYNTGVRLMADIDIPLRFNANYFSLQNISSVNLSNVKQLDDFNFGNFIITATNSFPFVAQIQAYLLNANKQVIDSLMLPGSNTIAYGEVDNQNIVVKEVPSVLNVSFDKAKITNLKQTKFIQLKSKFILPPNPPDIKILESYKLTIGIVAELNYNAKISR